MEKVDRRVQRTQQLLSEALIQLILEKGYDAVTIRDITERANVAYVTFFRNFESKEALMLLVVARITSHLEMVAHATYQAGENYHVKEGLLIFRHVEDNRALYRAMLLSSVRREVQQQLARSIFGHLQHHTPQARRVPLPLAANHMASALLNLIEWWLAQSEQMPPETMAAFYYQLVIQPVIEE